MTNLGVTVHAPNNCRLRDDEHQGTVVPGGEFAARVEFAPMLPGVSTTEILNQIEWERRVRKDQAEGT